MALLPLVWMVLLLIIGLSGYQASRTNATKRTQEKKWNQYHDRVSGVRASLRDPLSWKERTDE